MDSSILLIAYGPTNLIRPH